MQTRIDYAFIPNVLAYGNLRATDFGDFTRRRAELCRLWMLAV